MAEPDAEIAEQLYGAPLDEFIARRDARAKELRRGGDRAAADAGKKLRKPSVSAGAVKRPARGAPHDGSAPFGAGEGLKAAEAGGGGRGAGRPPAGAAR